MMTEGYNIPGVVPADASFPPSDYVGHARPGWMVRDGYGTSSLSLNYGDVNCVEQGATVPIIVTIGLDMACLLYTSPSPRDS